MKSKIFAMLTGMACLLTSCLDNDEQNVYQYEVDKNCQIKSFSLTSDSLPAVENVVFTIDQVNGRIMNLDSMDYGTVIEDKVKCSITYGTYVSKVEFLPEATGDTIVWEEAQDTVDISKPITIQVYNQTGELQRTYVAQLNIHKTDPDSLIWRKSTDHLMAQNVAEQKVIIYSDSYYMYTHASADAAYRLYIAEMADAETWKEIPLTGIPTKGILLSQLTLFKDVLYVPTTSGALYKSENGVDWTLVENTPSVKALLGGLGESTNQSAGLATIIEANNELKFAMMNLQGDWHTGKTVPSDFPIEGFAAQPVSLMYSERVMIAGGKTQNGSLVNSAWATMDALTWAKQTDDYSDKLFTKRQGVSMAYYDEMFYLIGGLDEAGKPLKDIYRSSDYGVTWNYIDSLVVLPSAYQARGFASLLVDKDNYLMIFGGQATEKGQVINDLWRGRTNHFGFERQ